MATNKGQSKVDQTKAELAKLREDQAARKIEIDALESELRRSVVAARTDKSEGGKKAQAQVDRVAAKLTKLRTDDTFDSIAIEELAERLHTEEADQCREQWAEQCANLSELIRRRLSWDKEQDEPLLAIVLKLKERVVKLQGLDAEISNALHKLKHRRLIEHCAHLRMAVGRPGQIVSARLQPVIESPFSSQFLGILAGADPGAAPYAERLLRVLDEIAETVPGEDATRQAPGKAPAAATNDLASQPTIRL